MVLTSSTALLLLSLNTAILLCFFLEKSGFLAGPLCCLSTCYLFKYKNTWRTIIRLAILPYPAIKNSLECWPCPICKWNLRVAGVILWNKCQKIHIKPVHYWLKLSYVLSSCVFIVWVVISLRLADLGI